MNAHTSITVADTALPIVEVDGRRVVTLAMVDKVHGRPDGTARRNFNTNRERLIEGQHYIVRNSSEAAALGIVAPNGLTVLTERGYLMLAKSFTDDLAWEVQDRLVDAYFRPPATVPALLDRGDRQVLGGIVKAVVTKAIADAAPIIIRDMLPMMLTAEIGRHRFNVSEQMTAGEVLTEAGIRERRGTRGLANQVSAALRRHCGALNVVAGLASLGGKNAYTFDPGIVREWLASGGRAWIQRVASEKMGQGRLALVKP